jgi:Holliday junction resolvase RusA-like endonuclease
MDDQTRQTVTAPPDAAEPRRLVIDDLQPLPKGRHRTGNGRPYTPERTRTYEHAVRTLARCQLGPITPFAGDVGADIVFYRKGRRRADLDNLEKAFLDALNGFMYIDDKQIVDKRGRVIYGHATGAIEAIFWRVPERSGTD